jgi:Sugar kinases, ribokinase family
MQPLTCLVLGDINIDFSLQTPFYPPEGGRTHAEHANFRLGGSGCMTAMTLSRLGCATALAGNLGSDVLGDWSLGRIAATGTDCRFVRRLADQQTGFFMLVATPGGSQTTFGSRGANALPLPADEIIPELVNSATCIYRVIPWPAKINSKLSGASLSAPGRPASAPALTRGVQLGRSARKDPESPAGCELSAAERA